LTPQILRCLLNIGADGQNGSRRQQGGRDAECEDKEAANLLSPII